MLVTELLGQNARKEAHDKAFYHHYIAIYWVKHYLGKGKMKKAMQEWDSIPQDDRNALWVAPTKGGCLTTKERAQLREGWEQRFRILQRTTLRVGPDGPALNQTRNRESA